MTRTVAVIGAGPAGLMAASVLQSQGAQVLVFDAMPSRPAASVAAMTR